MQPSAEASKISMDETFAYQKPKPKLAPAPVDQKQLMQSVVQKSIKLGQEMKKEKEMEKKSEPVKVPEEKKANDSKEMKTENKVKEMNNTAPAHEDDRISKARDLFQAK